MERKQHYAPDLKCLKSSSIERKQVFILEFAFSLCGVATGDLGHDDGQRRYQVAATIIFQLLRHEIPRNDHNLLEKGHNIKMCTSELQTDFEHRSMVKVLIVIARISYSVFFRQTNKNTALRIHFLLPPVVVGLKYLAGHLTNLLCILIELD